MIYICIVWHTVKTPTLTYGTTKLTPKNLPNHTNLTVYSPSENHSDYLKKNNLGLNLINIGNTRFDKLGTF